MFFNKDVSHGCLEADQKAKTEELCLCLRDISPPPEILHKIPAKYAVFYKVMPVAEKNRVLMVATATPNDIHIMDGLSLVVPGRVKLMQADDSEIANAISKYYGVGAETIDEMMDDVDVEVMSEVEDVQELNTEASIGKFINQVLSEAYKQRATDIHIEPYENDLKIRYRVDGILRDARVPANIWHFRDSINSRIKIMSHLNIAEKRLPQDGRFQVKVGDANLDLRISFLPTQCGESAVIRLLSSAKLFDMQELGLNVDEQALLSGLITKPHGIIFVTGPTGSGKTTTLYSCLAKINAPERKIITIEDPVEYQLKGISQIQINPTIGLTFARGLRSMLRHDPDIMMVGEVRDLETAQIAIQIALTGHLVFSTLHTNDAASGVTRLIDMGVEPYLISSSVECFIAQRLVRLNCPRCRTRRPLTSDLIEDFALTPLEAKETVIMQGQGCDECDHTGFRGRVGIYEFLLITDEIRELIADRASTQLIKRAAIAAGMKTLLEHGWEKVAQGLTTPEEIIRVTKEETA